MFAHYITLCPIVAIDVEFQFHHCCHRQYHNMHLLNLKVRFVDVVFVVLSSKKHTKILELRNK